MLGIIPFTGAVSVAAGSTNAAVIFAARFANSTTDNKFLQWSGVSNAMGDVVQKFQSTVSDSFEKIINAPIDDANFGISKFQCKEHKGNTANWIINV